MPLRGVTSLRSRRPTASPQGRAILAGERFLVFSTCKLGQ